MKPYISLSKFCDSFFVHESGLHGSFEMHVIVDKSDRIIVNEQKKQNTKQNKN